MKIHNLSKYSLYVVTALILAIVVYVRIRLLTVPLERDEGEFAYMGQLLLKGIPPFTHAYSMKLPGVAFVYALFMPLFGQTTAAVHLGLLFVNLFSCFLVYLLTKRLFDQNTALISCASYAVLSLSHTVYGSSAHATHFVVIFYLTGLVILLRYLDSGKKVLLFVSGLCFGLAFIMKQHAVLLVIFALVYLLWRGWGKPATGRKSDLINDLIGCILLLLGLFIPYALIAFAMKQAGAFDKFWFWTVQYASEYGSGLSFADGVNNLLFFMSDSMPQAPLWLLAAAGFILLCVRQQRQTDRPLIFGLLFVTFLSVCPGLYFRSHYFVMLLPVVAMLVGFACTSGACLFSSQLSERLRRHLPLVLIMTAIGYGLYKERTYLFIYTPSEVSRAMYGPNPFPESLQVARYIKEHTSGSDRIAVLGSEPQMYFYADRLSATGHIYMYGLMENQPYAERMQMEMMREIEAARPKYIVVVNVETSWLAKKATRIGVLDWGENYVRNFYDLEGIVDIIDPSTTRYIWDAKAIGYIPQSKAFLSIFKRKGGV